MRIVIYFYLSKTLYITFLKREIILKVSQVLDLFLICVSTCIFDCVSFYLPHFWYFWFSISDLHLILYTLVIFYKYMDTIYTDGNKNNRPPKKHANNRKRHRKSFFEIFVILFSVATYFNHSLF